ncbi:phosphoethanolamine transferase CptA [Pseudomonas sp. NW5]|uniref:phosphoethanolamine transferase CptA n=1 Tax=Pseudomonas sp. NW5 TaxID=2934934 RepID=UPI0020220D7F|nr:phosphoethanolamine transferase CptA [Pseudomonas sp. NW5]MCL7461573.1 phosphoethanolamine transferase CptA [Pseudomonas sp. NW5]
MPLSAAPSPQTTPETSASRWAALGWAYLFFWYFSGVYHLLLQLADATIFVGFRQAMIVSLLWLIPLLLFPRHTRALSAVLGGLLWLCSLTSLGYFMVYGQEFSQSVIFILFESNPREASEYAGQYFAWWMLPALLAYSAGAWWLWRRLRPLSFSPLQSGALVASILLGLFGYPALKLTRANALTLPILAETYMQRMEPATPWQLVFGYAQYRQRLEAMQALLEDNQRIAPLAELQDAHAGLPGTLVLVIGESTNRQHMGLYGYARDTTPKLQAIEDLEVFRNVIAARPYTIETLQQTLTFADPQNPERDLSAPSLMNLMKQAGYKTFWITNQQTLTKRNTMLTYFSQQTDEQIYLNHSRAQNAREYDSNVLAPFEQMLKDPAERKFIVVHLLGTHMKYEYRFPPEAAVYRDRTGLADWADEEQVEVINDYDNAVRFNDSVMAGLIERLRGSGDDGLLVYLSDHGEDVFDSGDHQVLGRNEASPTLPMYAVPFLLWRSEGWRARDPRDFSAYHQRPHALYDFIHTWSDLAGLSYQGHDASRSLLSARHVERPLWVGNPAQARTLRDFRPYMELDAPRLAGRRVTPPAIP